MTLYDFVTGVVDKRLPPFEGTGIKRDTGHVAFGKGRGKFFLSQTLSLTRVNNKWVANNTPYIDHK